MKREEFQSLSLSKQVQYINGLMTKGGSLSSICKDIGISKSVSAKYLKHGYELKDKQYILKPIEGQTGLFSKPQEAQEEPKEKIDIITPIEIKVIAEPQQEPRQVGRPKTRDKSQVVKLTMEINKDIVKALKFMSIDKEIYINQYIEELLQSNIPEKYFNI